MLVEFRDPSALEPAATIDQRGGRGKGDRGAVWRDDL